MHPSIKANTHIVQLKVTKNAHLPHHLLAWGQQFIKDFNCGLLSPKDGKVAPSTAPKVSSKGTAVSDEDQEELTASHDLMQICGAKGIAEPVGAPVQVLYHRPSLIHSRNESTSSKAEKGGTFSKYMPSKVPIKFVYYTECDQIVYYDSQNTLVAMSSASNDSTFFVGRRKEKSIDSEAAQYMAGERRDASYYKQNAILQCLYYPLIAFTNAIGKHRLLRFFIVSFYPLLHCAIAEV